MASILPCLMFSPNGILILGSSMGSGWLIEGGPPYSWEEGLNVSLPPMLSSGGRASSSFFLKGFMLSKIPIILYHGACTLIIFCYFLQPLKNFNSRDQDTKGTP